MTPCYLVVLWNLEDLVLYVLSQEQWVQYKFEEKKGSDPMTAISSFGGELEDFATVKDAITHMQKNGLYAVEEAQGISY